MIEKVISFFEKLQLKNLSSFGRFKYLSSLVTLLKMDLEDKFVIEQTLATKLDKLIDEAETYFANHQHHLMIGYNKKIEHELVLLQSLKEHYLF